MQRRKTKNWLRIYAFAMIVVSNCALSAAQLNGIVSLRHIHGAPGSGVEITAKGANPVITGNDGLFTLTFPQGHLGQQISIRASMPGWEVVNYPELDQRLPDSLDSISLEIIMCSSEERTTCAEEFYRLKGTEIVAHGYSSKAAKLTAGSSADKKTLMQLRTERDQALEQIVGLSKELAALTSADVSGGLRDAIRFYSEGNINGALKALDESRLRSESDDVKARSQEVMREWLFRARLMSATFDYSGAARAYHQVVEVAPASYSAWHEYGAFFLVQNNFAEAQRALNNAESLARAANDPVALSRILNDLGALNDSENRRTSRIFRPICAARRCGST